MLCFKYSILLHLLWTLYNMNFNRITMISFCITDCKSSSTFYTFSISMYQSILVIVRRLIGPLFCNNILFFADPEINPDCDFLHKHTT